VQLDKNMILDLLRERGQQDHPHRLGGIRPAR
jgi:hypothetical protein